MNPSLRVLKISKTGLDITFSTGRVLHGNFRAMGIAEDPAWEFRSRADITHEEFLEVVNFMIKQWKQYKKW